MLDAQPGDKMPVERVTKGPERDYPDFLDEAFAPAPAGHFDAAALHRDLVAAISEPEQADAARRTRELADRHNLPLAEADRAVATGRERFRPGQVNAGLPDYAREVVDSIIQSRKPADNVFDNPLAQPEKPVGQQGSLFSGREFNAADNGSASAEAKVGKSDAPTDLPDMFASRKLQRIPPAEPAIAEAAPTRGRKLQRKSPTAAEPSDSAMGGTFADRGYTSASEGGGSARAQASSARPAVTGLTDAAARTLLGNYLFYKRIAEGDRGEMANPQGHTPKTALAGLEHLQRQLPLAQWTQLEQSARAFHEAVDDICRRAVASGVYSAEKYEQTDPNSYATFAVLDHLNRTIPSGMKAQQGTFRDVANPFVSTLLKMSTLNRVIAWNEAKRTVVDVLRSFPEAGAEESRVRRGLSGDVVGFAPNKDPQLSGRIELMENGKVVGYDTSPYHAAMFERLTGCARTCAIGPSRSETTRAPVTSRASAGNLFGVLAAARASGKES